MADKAYGAVNVKMLKCDKQPPNTESTDRPDDWNNDISDISPFKFWQGQQLKFPQATFKWTIHFSWLNWELRGAQFKLKH